MSDQIVSAELQPSEVERLRDLLRELLAHDEQRFGPWTMGMRARVREAIGATECAHCLGCPPPHHDFCGSGSVHGEHPMDNGRLCCGRTP